LSKKGLDTQREDAGDDGPAHPFERVCLRFDDREVLFEPGHVVTGAVELILHFGPPAGLLLDTLEPVVADDQTFGGGAGLLLGSAGLLQRIEFHQRRAHARPRASEQWADQPLRSGVSHGWSSASHPRGGAKLVLS
jgi:hypothetical protein